MYNTLINIRESAQRNNDNSWSRYTRGGPKTWDGMQNTIQSLHRGANHFQYTILDRHREHCQQAQDNKQLRIKFICGEITEEKMKKNLMRNDTALEKKRQLLNVYELMGAVYTESVIDIHNAMLGYVNINIPVETRGMDGMRIGEIQNLLRRIHTNIEKVDRVRIYCNIELCKISGIYNQAVSVIDGIYGTPSFNKYMCKHELSKKNIGTLQPKLEMNQRTGQMQIAYEDHYSRRPIYI